MKIQFLTLLFASSILMACGGSSGSGKSKSSASTAPVSSVSISSELSTISSEASNSSSVSSAALLEGQFIDSPVAGIGYTTSRSDQKLLTDADGKFYYHAGDEVTFYLGTQVLGSALGNTLVSPLDLAKTRDIENPIVVNIARLLQTLDSDAVTPGIQIGDVPDNLPQINFDVDVHEFEQQPAVVALLNHVGGKVLVSVDDALQHLAENVGVPFSRTTLDCSSLNHYYCNDFSENADGWLFKPANNNSLQPDGNIEWVKIGANGMIRHTAASKGGVVALADDGVMANVPNADYAVEARFRPRQNGTTSNKQLYLMTRYLDGNNWYAGVLNVQNETTATQVEIAKNLNGSISRPVQAKRPIHQGARDQTDGVWYELRIESVGNTLTVYLDGERIGSHVDAQSAFTEKGTIGIWTANKSFEFDDVRIVSPEQKPVSLSIEPNVLTYKAEANDAPAIFSVNSTDSQGGAANFTVVSSNPQVVEVQVEGNQVTLQALAAGKATITFSSVLDANRKRVIEAQIEPEFVQSTTSYNLAGKAVPAANASEVYVDQQLRLTFDNQVQLGTYGLVRIYDALDDSLVDTISILNEKDSLGGAAVGASTRNINVNAIRAQDKNLFITPHAEKLKQGKTYWVALGSGVVAPNAINGVAFDGIGKTAGWQFSTRSGAVAAGLTEVVVDDNGSDAHFRSLQAALNYAMSNASLEVIQLKNGVYNEPLYLRNRNNLTIRGESRDETIVRYENNNALNASTDGRALFLISGGDNITLENFTLHNATLIGKGGQAETVYFNSDNGRFIAKQMNFFSEQDTILVKGWSWFYDSLIAGNVDFIWGYPKASLFEKSEIRTLGDSRGNGNGGYILQARVQSESDKGFVFLNSSLTHGEGPLKHTVGTGVTHLARSGGDTKVFDNIVFVNTKMDTHIAPRGWAGLGVANQPRQTPELANTTAGWREFGTMDMSGNNLLLNAREFMYELSLAEVTPYCSRAAVFSAFDNGAGWNPLPSDTSDCINPDGVNSLASSSLFSDEDNSPPINQ